MAALQLLVLHAQEAIDTRTPHAHKFVLAAGGVGANWRRKRGICQCSPPKCVQEGGMMSRSSQRPDQAITPPNGCRWCGIGQYEHAQRWMPEVGWHEWTPPTDEQRKSRMKARLHRKLDKNPPHTALSVC
ncbi:hypothetical protein ACPA54_30970 [Uniformispora flossi]|uniref:hypothetical protein n=1 Tax=Uniformispora flossi TaxID=3390723 RepID=UPI003C2FB08A